MAWPDIAVSGSATNIVDPPSGTFSWSHTGAGNKLLVFVGEGKPSPSTSAVTSVTYNGIALTLKQHYYDTGDAWSGVSLFEYNGTISGTNTIVVTHTGGISVDFFGCAISFDGAATALGTIYTASGTTQNPSVTVVDSANGDYVVSFVSSDESVTDLTQGGTLIAEAEDVAADNDFNGQYQLASGGNTACSWSRSSTNGEWWAAMGVAVRPSSVPVVAKKAMHLRTMMRH